MWLQILSGPDAGQVAEIPATRDTPFVLGRVRGVDLVIRDERASRRHAEVVPLASGGLHLRDLGSANGTEVDGDAVQDAELLGGEELRIGDVRIAVLVERPVGPDASPVTRARAGQQPDLTLSIVGRMVDRRARPLRAAAFAGVVLAAGAVAAVVLLAGDEEDPIPDVVRTLNASVVRVEADRERGSGFVYDDGVVVTNAHVVNGGLPLRAGGRPATLVGAAPCSDLAVLGTDTSGLRRVRVRRDVRAGETVVAVGFPVGSESASSTTGVVSASAASLRDPAPDVPVYERVILTDTALNPGNSGGPLADTNGRVIGVNAAARTSGADGRPLQGQNYALPMAQAVPVIESLLGGASPGWIGATFTYPTISDLAERRLPAGIFVASVLPDTPAADAGLRAGDLIIGAGGRAVRETLASWCAAVGERPVRSLTVHRDGRQVDIALTGDR